MPGASQVHAELLNTLGQVVRRQSASLPSSGARFTVPTAGLAVGVYVLRLQAGSATVTKRVVIE
ncbi:MAG: T9SS type A sorting domain-containing protein [Cytophagaceae bacterium]|nr:MAG: T9SS type A sorting domain-containing protein [Cytophagaceae bacterium]